VITFNLVLCALLEQLSIRRLLALANYIAIDNLQICCWGQISLPGDAVEEVCLVWLAELEWSICRLCAEDNHVDKLWMFRLKVLRVVPEDPTSGEDTMNSIKNKLGRRKSKVSSVVLI